MLIINFLYLLIVDKSSLCIVKYVGYFDNDRKIKVYFLYDLFVSLIFLCISVYMDFNIIMFGFFYE